MPYEWYSHGELESQHHNSRLVWLSHSAIYSQKFHTNDVNVNWILRSSVSVMVSFTFFCPHVDIFVDFLANLWRLFWRLLYRLLILATFLSTFLLTFFDFLVDFFVDFFGDFCWQLFWRLFLTFQRLFLSIFLSTFCPLFCRLFCGTFLSTVLSTFLWDFLAIFFVNFFVDFFVDLFDEFLSGSLLAGLGHTNLKWPGFLLPSPWPFFLLIPFTLFSYQTSGNNTTLWEITLSTCILLEYH